VQCGMRACVRACVRAHHGEADAQKIKDEIMPGRCIMTGDNKGTRRTCTMTQQTALATDRCTYLLYYTILQLFPCAENAHDTRSGDFKSLYYQSGLVLNSQQEEHDLLRRSSSSVGDFKAAAGKYKHREGACG